MTKIDIKLNKAAQGLVSLQDVRYWYSTVSKTEQVESVVSLQFFISQAHPSHQTIAKAIKESMLSNNSESRSILENSNIDLGIWDFSETETKHLEEYFYLVMILYKMADSVRRKRFCSNGCTHEWHNLS